VAIPARDSHRFGFRGSGTSRDSAALGRIRIPSRIRILQLVSESKQEGGIDDENLCVFSILKAHVQELTSDPLGRG
jgi:hypothetical protein